jgi:hypothetical protein
VLPHVSTRNMSLLKFLAIGAVGVFVGDKIHSFAIEKFPGTFALPQDTPTKETLATWLGYATIGLGVAGTLFAAHALLGKKS